ncbi:WD repeat-containing protein 47-like isoform X2 [Panonychus citri]|uniref:WD repeat-containing protein 47-like isoform X2 n=1 Tax=Panonychus citri TaxID=50023 RepID=UPI0023072EAD|nr:WD repeat-containing protein 47-like isoform X2 [Panonychus citri]
MPSSYNIGNFILREEDVIRMVLEFLNNRDLSISQLSLERETGVHNGLFSDDLLFLRQLIIDGQWDDCLQFIEPLEILPDFNVKGVKYCLHKHQYLELLCIRAEAGPYQNVEVAVNEVVECLKELEKCCPSKEDYNELCLLLTLPSLAHHPDYKNWNPSNSRIKCFNTIHALIEKYLPYEKKPDEKIREAKADRLLQLIIKGILYESCVNFCETKATFSAKDGDDKLQFCSLLEGCGFTSGDLSLLSWLQSIPTETFSYPFEQKTLSVDVEQIQKPSLVASWSEMIMVTPIKPKIFPHLATPFTRLKASDLMSKSLTTGLLDSLPKNNVGVGFSVGEIAEMSRSSIAGLGFHLKSSQNEGKTNDQNGVDKLFESDLVFSSSCIDKLPTVDSKSSLTTRVNQTKESNENEPSNQLEHEKSQKNQLSSLNDTHPIDVPKTESSSKSANQIKLTSTIKDSPDLWVKFQKQRKQSLEKSLWEESIIKEEDDTQCESFTQLRQNNRQKPAHHFNQHQSSSSSSLPGANNSQLSSQLTPNSINPFKPRYDSIPESSAIPMNSYLPKRGQTLNNSVQNNKKTPLQPTQQSTSPSLNQNQQLTNDLSQKHGPGHKSISSSTTTVYSDKKAQFVPVTRLEDAQAIRAAEFHPSGKLYAIGSNSKTLRVCSYPLGSEIRAIGEDHEPYQPTVLFKRCKHHKGSIYCLAWNASGDLLATGSNDKTIKLMRFDADRCDIVGTEADLTMHDGTVRDLCFMEDLTNGSNLLISGGAGDCKIYITDCETATPFQALSGHSGHILSLYTWGGAMFVSGSQDRTIRFWDLRTRGCVNLITAPPISGSIHGSAVSAVCVDPSGRLLVSGHEDANCMLYDIRGGRIIQTIRPHSSEVRTIRFSPKAYYLLTGGYDNKIILTDLQGDLTQPLPSIVVAEHTDKVIQGRWHPNDFTFLTTSADRTATLWTLPN